MELFTSPRSYALNTFLRSHDAAYGSESFNHAWALQNTSSVNPMADAAASNTIPNFGHLTVLVIEAVLEVVFVALPGYIVASQGYFDAESQKFLANLNVMIFTPCLVFTKLAKQLTADKLVDLAIIPVIYICQTFVSYMCSVGVSKFFGFKQRPRNFVTAMAVFANSNSLPISLVMSLSQTISGLHWDKVPGDNDSEVAARGILYLLIFQQLGQLLRWTWGYNVLLKPKSAYTEEEGGMPNAVLESGLDDDQMTIHNAGSRTHSVDCSGDTTPLLDGETPAMSRANSDFGKSIHEATPLLHDKLADSGNGSYVTFPSPRQRISRAIPKPVQNVAGSIKRFVTGIMSFMNPPMWALLVAVFVASIPPLQEFLFKEGSFMENSVMHGIEQSAGVCVPLILVVLGANLARNTIPVESIEDMDPSEPSDKKLLIAALVCRMVLPTIIMAPIMAFIAKFVPVSILGDPIFVIVVFLLIGAPSALQLAQICQLNNVYMGAVSKLLFQSYVVWILPNTLLLVMLALKVVQWAGAA